MGQDKATLLLTTASKGAMTLNLMGRRILQPRRGGIYIIGGQKVMIK